MRRIFILGSIRENSLKPVFAQDYELSLNRDMIRVKEGYWKSRGAGITLDTASPKTHHYIPRYTLENGTIVDLDGKILRAVEYCEEGKCYFICCVSHKGGNEIVLLTVTSNRTVKKHITYVNSERPDFHFEEGGIRIIIGNVTRKISLPIHPELYHANRNTDVTRCVTVKHGGLSTLVLLPNGPNRVCPAITVCLGGPYIEKPEYDKPESIYQLFLNNGFAVIIPLRRGVLGISPEWAKGLSGNYGHADVDDIIAGTEEAIKQVTLINKYRVGVYGASYGGYTATLAAEFKKHQQPFKAACVVCAMTDPEKYPYEGQGDIEETKSTYKDAPSPLRKCEDFQIPSLIIHTCDDETVWFGQSVRLYNKLLERNKDNTQLVLFAGPHSMDISNGKELKQSIIRFYKDNLCG